MDSLGGYRLVRKLGEGPRAEVFLAHPSREGGEARQVAMKVFRPEVTDASIAAEIESLSRAAGDHVAALRDVTTGPGGALVLILDRIGGSSLDRLLRDRRSLEIGEAITVLAPLALAVRRAHLAGVVHGALRRESVLFDSAGTPVLARFGRAFPITPGQPPATLDAVPGVALDIAAFAGLASMVLNTVDHPDARSLVDWITSSPSREHAAWFDELAGRLFDLGSPEPLDFRVDESHHPASRIPARMVGASLVAESHAEPAPALPGHLVALLPDDLAEAVQAALDRVRGALRIVRPRVWAVAGAIAVALVAALVLVPQGDSGAAAGRGASAIPTVAATNAPDSGPVGGDDPVTALVALLAAREGCIRDLSVLCLDAVDQAASAALADDEALVRSLQAGAESPGAFRVNSAQVTIDERLGDSVILDLDGVAESEPASILLMKGEAGWRIRDYLEE